MKPSFVQLLLLNQVYAWFISAVNWSMLSVVTCLFYHMQKEVHPLKASKNGPYFGNKIVQNCSIHFFVNTMFDEDSVDWYRRNLQSLQFREINHNITMQQSRCTMGRNPYIFRIVVNKNIG